MFGIIAGLLILCLATAIETVFFEVYASNINIVSIPLNCPLYYKGLIVWSAVLASGIGQIGDCASMLLLTYSQVNAYYKLRKFITRGEEAPKWVKSSQVVFSLLVFFTILLCLLFDTLYADARANNIEKEHTKHLESANSLMVLYGAKIVCWVVFIAYIVHVRLLIGKNDNYRYKSSFIKILLATLNIATALSVIIVGVNTEEWERKPD